jgi:hypothetical protein
VKITEPNRGAIAKFMRQEKKGKGERLLFGDKKGKGATLIMDHMTEDDRNSLLVVRRPR